MAGILLEMRVEANGPSAVVIGVGLNMAMSKNKIKTKITQPWIDLESIMGAKIERNYFTALVIDALFEVLNAVPDKQKELLQEWQSMDVLKGEEIEVHFADKVIQGKALGINPDGALRVLHRGKELVCHSGEVSIRRNK